MNLHDFFKWQMQHADMISCLFTGYLCVHGDLSYFEFSKLLYLGEPTNN